MRDSELFDDAVTKFFRPLALKLGLPLNKVGDGVYAIASPHFIARIRLHTGHRRGLNVLLRPAALQNYDENSPGEYGIGCFMQFNGEDMQSIILDVHTDEDFLKQSQLLTEALERFGIPYLLGQKDDFEAVKEMIRTRGAPGLERIKQMQRKIERNMPKVQQEWTIPEDEMPK